MFYTLEISRSLHPDPAVTKGTYTHRTLSHAKKQAKLPVKSPATKNKPEAQ
jgi:hypothetical protein